MFSIGIPSIFSRCYRSLCLFLQLLPAAVSGGGGGTHAGGGGVQHIRYVSLFLSLVTASSHLITPILDVFFPADTVCSLIHPSSVSHTCVVFALPVYHHPLSFLSSSSSSIIIMIVILIIYHHNNSHHHSPPLYHHPPLPYIIILLPSSISSFSFSPLYHHHPPLLYIIILPAL